MYTFIRFFCFCYCCFSIHYFDTAWHLTSQPINFTLDSLFSRWNQVLIKYGDVLQILFFSHLKLSNQWQEELSISTNLMVCSNWLEFFDEMIDLFLDSKKKSYCECQTWQNLWDLFFNRRCIITGFPHCDYRANWKQYHLWQSQKYSLEWCCAYRIFPGIRKTKSKETMNMQTNSDECCLLMSYSFKCASWLHFLSSTG